MQFETLDVSTAEGHTLKVGVCANGRGGPSVLILPGLFSHMGWYRPLGEALAQRGATAFLLDRRGAGISGGVPGHMDSWHHVVDDVRRVVERIRSLQPQAPVCGLGVSLGSAMTLAVSLVHPDCFQRQAALSPGLAPGLRLSLRRRIGLAYRGVARPRFLYEVPFTMEQLTDQEELRRALWDDPLRTRVFTARFLLEVFRMQRFVRRNADRLRVPVLALLGEQDAMVDNAVALATLRRVVRAPVRVEIFEGAHHVLPATVPVENLVARIHRWFTANESELGAGQVVRRIGRPDALAQREEAEAGRP